MSRLAGQKVLNFVLLVGSFAAGQGSIFVAQTWLVARGDLELLAAFGTHFSFAMLFLMLVDGGALTLFARHASEAGATSGGRRRVWLHFWEVTASRFAVATVMSLILLVVLFTTSSSFTRGYLMFGLPALFIWSFNVAGMLDGMKMSGLSGASSSISYVASAVGLLFSSRHEVADAGAILGSALTVGYLVTLIAQFASLRVVAGVTPQLLRPAIGDIVVALRHSIAVLATTVPGQILFRVQLLMSGIALGMNETAIFIYVKQIVVAQAQTIGFVRRIEFPGLVERLRSSPGGFLKTISVSHRIGTLFGGVGAVGTSVAGAVGIFAAPAQFVDVAYGLLWFGCIVWSSGWLLGLTRGAHAIHLHSAPAITATIAMVVSIVLSALLAPFIGIAGFAIGDVVSQISAAMLLSRYIERQNAERKEVSV